MKLINVAMLINLLAKVVTGIYAEQTSKRYVIVNPDTKIL